MVGTQHEKFLATSTRRIDYHPVLSLPRYVFSEYYVWLFSPLGGQATLRIIEYKDISIVLQQEIGYLGLSKASFSLGMKMSDNGEVFDNINTAFLASLASPRAIKDGQQDTWANIKVPMIEGILRYISSRDNSSDWITLPDHLPNTRYSLLIGIPTANIPDTGTTSFTMETSYRTIQCPELIYPKDYDDAYWVHNTLPTFNGIFPIAGLKFDHERWFIRTKCTKCVGLDPFSYEQ
ncbi:hypothetical protein F4813DRAFT_134544 [Daldinia decipiens]|uniref:uncharacterized protein n=1 Tax=Daldinia decipiens TaxID=326647 RepID=UPI0020C50EBB|nr:uncharacterized protein F4813DRAFT_134544 [Daldinia decipiens]KAI1656405.1 hypothetical protein F4813DRAFT_134544 [Daldinia decipiens]